MNEADTWLLVGGAGYIGKHVARCLQDMNIAVAILDDYSTGSADGVPTGVPIVVGSSSDRDLVSETLSTFSVTGVIHLAALKHARESVSQPLKYWDRNISALMGVLSALETSRVTEFLLSSSCSVYGNASGAVAGQVPQPMSPYAWTKLVSERIVADVCDRLDISWTALRYFNVIGCGRFSGARDESLECLIPVVRRCLEDGHPVPIFGNDFETADGTGERDYVDVRDLAYAHALVAKALTSENTLHLVKDKVLNVGTGTPVSVRQVLDQVEDTTGAPVDVRIEDRRPGDPDRVWALPSPELKELGWESHHTLADSIASHFADFIHITCQEEG